MGDERCGTTRRGCRAWIACLAALACAALAAPAGASAIDVRAALDAYMHPAPAAARVRATSVSGAVIAPAITADGSDTIFANGLDNNGSQCLTVPDCPPSPAECISVTCTEGMCGNANSVGGSACSGGVCDGSGSCVQCNLPTDCPPTGSECIDALCVANTCASSAAQEGTVCSQGVCNGFGACVQCVAPSDCPPAGECKQPVCNGNVCGTNNLTLGTICAAGLGLCDGNGNCIL